MLTLSLSPCTSSIVGDPSSSVRRARTVQHSEAAKLLPSAARQRRRRRAKRHIMRLIWLLVIFLRVASWRPLGSHWRRETSVNLTRHNRLGTNRARGRHLTKESASGKSCVRWRSVLLGNSVTTAERLRPRIVVTSAACDGSAQR